MAALLALASAVTFGVADFVGGLTARRAPALVATALSQSAGLLVVVPGLLLVPGVLSGSALGAGAVGGVAGAAGLVLYLRGLAIGPMGLVAPIAGASGAALPVVAGLLQGDRPSTAAYLGIGLGLTAVVLASGTDLLDVLRSRRARTGGGSSDGVAAGHRPHVHAPLAAPGGAIAVDASEASAPRAPAGRPAEAVVLALLSGIGFGAFFVALDLSPAGSGWWPLLGARAAGVALLVAALTVRRAAIPRDRTTLLMGLTTGVLDMSANALFLAATRSGLLSLAALITSLYPVVVAGLAAGVLRERLDRLQIAGVAACLAAVALIALG